MNPVRNLEQLAKFISRLAIVMILNTYKIKLDF
mgnify:CR=1 FL=1